jgi:hypothetical protein
MKYAVHAGRQLFSAIFIIASLAGRSRCPGNRFAGGPVYTSDIGHPSSCWCG